MTSALLQVDDLHVAYGPVGVLNGASLTVGAGEVVTILGSNGAGKTTLLRAIAGLVRHQAGSIRFDGSDIGGMPAHDKVACGLCMVPEGRQLFPDHTVLENLELGAFNASARPNLKASLDDVLAHFPILAERRQQLAGSLSGGERQMCAIARAMMSQPKLLMLDEPSLGLSPLMVERVFELILSLAREKNIAVLLVEQNVGDALGMANRGYIIEHGRVIKSGTGEALLADQDVQRAYLGL